MTNKGRMTAYINPQSSQQFRNAAGYTLADGSPALDVVCIFRRQLCDQRKALPTREQ